MPAHVFHVPQPYRVTAQDDGARESRSKFRWLGDTFRISNRSRSRSANGRGSRPSNQPQVDEDEFVMRTSPPKPVHATTKLQSSSTLGRRAVGRPQSSSTNQTTDDHSIRMRHHKSARDTSPNSSRDSSLESDGCDALSGADDSSFFSKLGGQRRKTLHVPSPSSFNSVHSVSSTRPTPLEDDEYDSLSDHDDHCPESPLKGKQRLHVTSPESRNSLRSSTASTVSIAVLSDDSPSSRSSITSSADGEPSSPHDIASPRVEYATRKLLRGVMGLDADWESDAHADRHYEKIHWRVVRIQADGNCLFRAISDQIYRNEAFHTDIRRRIVDFISRKRDLFRPFVENEEPGQVESIDAYCKRMQQDGQWGGNPELYAAARLFNVHLVVHQGPLRRLRITNKLRDQAGSNEPYMELHLLYRNDHYDSLHDESNVDEKARLSLTVHLAATEPSTTEDNQIPNPATSEADASTTNQTETQTATKPRKGKRVVFLGEQTRVERVEMPTVVVVAPCRAVLRRGKVHSVMEPVATIQIHTADKDTENEDATDSDDDDSCSTSGSPVDNQSCPSDEDDDPESVVRFAKVKRICFRQGRRID